jgi:cell division protein FtsB
MIAKRKKFHKHNIQSSSRKKGLISSFKAAFLYLFLASIVLLTIGFLSLSNWQMNQKREELRTRIENLKKEIEALAKKNEDLSNQISQSQKESFFEKEAREKFNLKKPGEEEIVILAPEESSAPEETVQPRGFWEEILKKLGF